MICYMQLFIKRISHNKTADINVFVILLHSTARFDFTHKFSFVLRNPM